MAKRFYRIGPAIWLEPWDDDTRMVAFYLLTSPHRTTEGLFRLPMQYGRTDMGWPARRFDAAFKRLLAAGFIEYDAEAQVVLLTSALKWQTPANPNQRTGAVRVLRELPPTPLFDRFRALARTHAPALAEQMDKELPQPVANGSPTVAEPLRQPVANTLSLTQASTNPPNPPGGESTPPRRPSGNRKKDIDTWQRSLAAWTGEHFPGVAPGLVDSCAQTLRAGRVEPTVDALAPLVAKWTESAA